MALNFITKDDRLIPAAIDKLTPATWICQDDPPSNTRELMALTVTEFMIGPHDMEMIYMSPDPYGRTFKETMDLWKWKFEQHRTALHFITKDDRLIPAAIDKLTPGAWILYATRHDGIYFWHTKPLNELPDLPLPTVHSNHSDLLLHKHPHHNATIAVAYGNSDWATCIKT